MSSRQRTSDDLRAVADALRSHDRFLVVTHENPDGDAFGSLLAAKLALASLGKDVEMYLYGDAPVPKDYAWMQLDDLRRELPPDASERVLLALDCANNDRIGPGSAIVEAAPLTVNVDHHQDNTLFGDVNLVVADASSTSEVLRELFAELDVELTPEIAEALYVALVTDTGCFQYTNTTSKTLLLAAELVDAGVDPHHVFQMVFESTEFKKLKLLGRVLERAEIYEGGRLVVSHLLRSDFTELNVPEDYSEGLIDTLRKTDGADMVALIREPPGPGGPARRVSLRARTDELDVSAIAAKSKGGGHRQAAGFSSDASIDEITRFIREEFARAAPGA
ncbi:MAG TPA: bifunctional oligoribonuclease/PAP phosphatase NrnA [Gaiellaceae bacterium]|nr:bifunctional oligoribonuclease/PAP phosphatase NrnA [Gaiellaceae bacterium]